MRRLFWLALGVTVGALAVRKLSRAAEKLTPGGMARSFGDGLAVLADSISEFAADVRATMRDRESDLRAAAGVDAAADNGSRR